ncbi:hypothetical protein L1987_72542 [Smallanthus sonchifolius]|uniref:Uncharacterized protein n=1 Tax=Smallanthus sonchifolius TaxID=185202 RepID=A0ACB9AUK8_9ASTR|nr:hypothetical protein L1987_72542 [Smallanthus sonchifolius]
MSGPGSNWISTKGQALDNKRTILEKHCKNPRPRTRPRSGPINAQVALVMGFSYAQKSKPNKQLLLRRPTHRHRLSDLALSMLAVCLRA